VDFRRIGNCADPTEIGRVFTENPTRRPGTPEDNCCFLCKLDLDASTARVFVVLIVHRERILLFVFDLCKGWEHGWKL
jgi:hypothetical protein